MILLIPGLELIRVFFIRLINKKNPFKGNKNHLHHYLIEKTNLTNSLLIFIFLSSIPTILNQFATKILSFLIPTAIYFLIIYLLKNKSIKS